MQLINVLEIEVTYFFFNLQMIDMYSLLFVLNRKSEINLPYDIV